MSIVCSGEFDSCLRGRCTGHEVPVDRVCDACDGSGVGCGRCGSTGWIDYEGCPADLLTEEVLRLFEVRNWAELGVLPVFGGLLDQTAIGIIAVSYLRSRIEMEKNRRSHGAPHLEE